jgi:formate dehydrogenase maturation protein FdhE
MPATTVIEFPPDAIPGSTPAESAPDLRPPMLPRERARLKLEAGVPLLHGEAVDPDLGFCRSRFRRLLEAPPERLEADAQQAIRFAFESGRLDLDRALDEALAGHHDHLSAIAQAAAVPFDPLVSLALEAVRPSLERLAVAFRPLYASTDNWRQAYCPVCGGSAAQVPAAVQGERRYRRCARCGAEWGAVLDRDPGASTDFRLELGDEEPDEALDDLLELD